MIVLLKILKICLIIIFDTIVDEKELISLELKDEKNDLFHEVAEDIIDQLNSEIR